MPPKAQTSRASGGRKRKRPRKARTNAVLSSSSSSSSSSSDDSDTSSSSEEDQHAKDKVKVKNPTSASSVHPRQAKSDKMELDSDSSSSDDSDSDSNDDISSSSSSSSSRSKHRTPARTGATCTDPSHSNRTSPPPVEYNDESILSDLIASSIRGDFTLGHLTRLPAPASSLPRPLSPDFLELVERRRREKLKAEEEEKRTQHSQRNKQEEEEEEVASKEDQTHHLRRERLKRLARPAVQDSEAWLTLFTESFGDELDSLRRREPNLTLPGKDSRLHLLIDAISAGSEPLNI